MKTPRTLMAGLLFFLLVGMPRLGEAQSIRAAAVGFSYATAPLPDVMPRPLATGCEPDRAAGAAIGVVVGVVAGALTGFVFDLSSLLTGPNIPIERFVVAGAVAGGILGAVAGGSCPSR